MIVDGNAALWGGVRSSKKKIPPYHVVKQGDTLWDVCDHYYNDPWAWPQLWAFNKGITNPHWIYPGDRIRLLGASAPKKGGEPLRVRRTRDRTEGPILLKQNGFADPTELEKSGSVSGSKQERLLLSERDELYLGKMGHLNPQPGQAYTVYRVRKKLVSPDGTHVGHLVDIRGTVRIKKVDKNKAATGVITESVNPIERGDRVGPLRRRFRRLPVTPADKTITGRVIGGFADKVYHGINELIFIDKGANHGVRKGNRFLVMQWGDGYKRLLQDEDDENPEFPREVTAEVLIIDLRKNASVGLITRATKETKAGDYVKMRSGY
jgi:hypothetical protein